MTAKHPKKKRAGLFVFYIYGLLILAILLTAATYAWFSLSRTPRVSDLGLHIISAHGLELSASPETKLWTQQLDFLDLVDQTAPLRPVTWSEAQQQFLAATYGVDGRLTDRWLPLSDDNNANRDSAHGYYTKVTFYARSGQPTTVTLSPAVAVEEGLQGAGTYVIGTPVWNSQQVIHDNGGNGAQCAVRVGFRITRLKSDGTADEDVTPTFIIYEPNADTHSQGEDGYTPTPSIDGTPLLVSEDRLILQTTSTWQEVYPVERDVLIHRLGDFTTDTQLFRLDAEETVRIDLYLWLEGQDVDCTNQIHNAQILANIQFGAQADGMSGLEPIDEE